MTKKIGVGGCGGGCGGNFPPILVPACSVLESGSLTPRQAAAVAQRDGTYQDWIDDVPIQGPTDRDIRRADCWWKNNVLDKVTNYQGAIVPQWTQQSLCIGNRSMGSGVGAPPPTAALPGIWSKLSDAESHWIATTLVQLNALILKAGNQPCATWPADLLKDDASAVAKMPAAVACFQGWYNTNLKPSALLRTDGTLDDASLCALVTVTKEHPTDFTTPYPGSSPCGLSMVAKVGIGVAVAAAVGGTIAIIAAASSKKKPATGSMTEARSKPKTVWAVEVWNRSHWTTVRGGLSKSEAKRQARIFVAQSGGRERVSIAEYEPGEGSSAVKREPIE